MKRSRMYNFLIELLLTTLIFAISMIVVVNIFVTGNKLNNKTDILNKNHSTYISVIERMKVYKGEDIDTYLSDLNLNNIKIDYYDDNFDIKLVYDDEVLASTKVYYVGDKYE